MLSFPPFTVSEVPDKPKPEIALISGIISSVKVDVMCVINSSPGLVVTWRHDGRELVQDERTTIDLLEAAGVFLAELVITDVTADDNGVYACEAVNSAGADPVVGRELLEDLSLSSQSGDTVSAVVQKRSVAMEDSTEHSLCASDSLNTGVCV